MVWHHIICDMAYITGIWHQIHTDITSHYFHTILHWNLIISHPYYAHHTISCPYHTNITLHHFHMTPHPILSYHAHHSIITNSTSISRHITFVSWYLCQTISRPRHAYHTHITTMSHHHHVKSLHVASTIFCPCHAHHMQITFISQPYHVASHL